MATPEKLTELTTSKCREGYPPFLPPDLETWKAIHYHSGDGLKFQNAIWKSVGSTFLSKGYKLYTLHPDGLFVPPWAASHTVTKYQVHGSSQHFEFTSFMSNTLFAAIDDDGEHVIIKVVTDGHSINGNRELAILRFLDQPNLREDPRNRTISVIEFVEHEQYTFAIFPRCHDFPLWVGSFKPYFKWTPQDALSCIIQVCECLVFLHEHRIAHLDISQENVLRNSFGAAALVSKLPKEWRLIDFGEAVLVPTSSPTIPGLDYSLRESAAPEVSSGLPFDPFAADVYQFGKFIFGNFYDLTGVCEELIPILLDTAHVEPSRRISMSELLIRLQDVQKFWEVDPNRFVPWSEGIMLNKYERTILNSYAMIGEPDIPVDAESARQLRWEMMRRQHKEDNYHPYYEMFFGYPVQSYEDVGLHRKRKEDDTHGHFLGWRPFMGVDALSALTVGVVLGAIGSAFLFRFQRQ